MGDAYSENSTMRPRVYISGPITKGDRNWNVYQAFDAQRRLIDAGFAPMNPMASCCYPFAWEEGFPASVWLETDLPWIEVCDAVLRLPGDSDGADREVEYAIQQRVAVYHDIDALIRDANHICQTKAVETVEHLSQDAGIWSDATFGHSWNDGDEAGLGSLHHLREEVDELIDRPGEMEEWADVFMLFLDASRRRSIPFASIVNATREKLEVNKRRNWGAPDENGVVHHVKSE